MKKQKIRIKKRRKIKNEMTGYMIDLLAKGSQWEFERKALQVYLPLFLQIQLSFISFFFIYSNFMLLFSCSYILEYLFLPFKILYYSDNKYERI